MNILRFFLWPLIFAFSSGANAQSLNIENLILKAGHSELLISEKKILLTDTVQIITDKHYISSKEAVTVSYTHLTLPTICSV